MVSAPPALPLKLSALSDANQMTPHSHDIESLHAHDHCEEHVHHHDHADHDHEDHHHHHHEHHSHGAAQKILTIRLHSGIAGDMFLCGLMCMLGMNNEEADSVLNGIFSELKGSVHLEDKFVGGIRGSFCRVELPHEHEHRRLSDVRAIIEKARMSNKAKELALKTFGFVAEAEGKVHGMTPEEVSFHEVGALDSRYIGILRSFNSWINVMVSGSKVVQRGHSFANRRMQSFKCSGT